MEELINKLGIRQSYPKKPRASDELAQRSPDKNTQGINKLEDYRSFVESGRIHWR